MTSATISVTAAGSNHFEGVVALLAAAQLPTLDLTPACIDRFLVATDAHEMVGAVALERYGEVGLLRSLVVAPAWRGKGVGGSLVAAIEQRARGAEIRSLVLLTETAGRFFAEIGYAIGNRADAPEAVRASSEFAVVCPSSAVYMHKRLR
jgi:amino-acid N-acetyltransferase